MSFSLSIIFAEQILSKTSEYFRFETITKINLIDYSEDDNYPYVSFILEEDIPFFPIELFVRYKNNSFDSPEKNVDDILEKISNDTWENVNYTTVELTEFLLDYYNISKNDLFDKTLLNKYLINDIYIFPNKRLFLILLHKLFIVS